jgi:Tol biopolymer transport system component
MLFGLLLIGFSALAWGPATANATVAFNTNPPRPEVWVSEHEDGAEPKDLGSGLVVQASPDGKRIAYQHGTHFEGWQLVIYDVATGHRSVRLTHLHQVGESWLGERTAFAWSPDSTEVAAVQKEKRTGRQTLYVIGAEPGGSKARIATGYFRGVSFSPDGTQVVFGFAHGDGPLAKTDIARAPVTGGPITLLTHDHISGWPLWGPGGQIALAKRTKAERYKFEGGTRTSEAFDLYVMRENGGGAKRMTKVGYEAGVFPGFWMPSGDELVANFQSLEKNYAALVTPARGTVKPLNPPISGQGLAGFDAGFAGIGLSADGQSVLGCRGTVVNAIEPMASVPLAGGKPMLIDKSYWSPSWSGVSSAGTSPC